MFWVTPFPSSAFVFMVALPKVAMLDFVRWISSELEDLQYLPSVNITLRSRHAKNFFMVTGCCLLTLLYVCLSLVYNPYIVSSLVNVQRKLLARLFCIHTNRQKCGWMNSSNSNPMDGWSIKMLLLIVLVLCQNQHQNVSVTNASPWKYAFQ